MKNILSGVDDIGISNESYKSFKDSWCTLKLIFIRKIITGIKVITGALVAGYFTLSSRKITKQ